MLSVNEKNFEQEVLESSIPVLVNFWAPWCGLCQLISPHLSEFQTKWAGEIKLVKVNADESLRLASTYRLTNLPTLLLIVDGKVTWRLDSFRGRDELRLALDNLMVSCVRSV